MSQPTMSFHKDARIIGSPRIATIAEYDEQNLGVCIFLTAEQLQDLGIDQTGCDAVGYAPVRINGGYAVGIAEVGELPHTAASGSIGD